MVGLALVGLVAYSDMEKLLRMTCILLQHMVSESARLAVTF